MVVKGAEIYPRVAQNVRIGGAAKLDLFDGVAHHPVPVLGGQRDHLELHSCLQKWPTFTGFPSQARAFQSNSSLTWCYFYYFYSSFILASPAWLWKVEQALGSVTHALTRKHYPYRPGHPGAHLCPAKSMVDTPTMAAPWAHVDPLQSYPVIRELNSLFLRWELRSVRLVLRVTLILELAIWYVRLKVFSDLR